MATKKEKRAAALRRHEGFMEARRQSGLRAQAAAQADRDREMLTAWQKNHDKNHSESNRIVECPHCRLAMREDRLLQNTGVVAS